MADLIGQTLGQYRIEAPLGSGGMGQVFRGVHVLLERPAAIKVMQAHLAANPEFRSRFLREAKAAAALRHPNIVEIYEFGEQDGNLYLVMELINDGSLRTILRRNAGQPLSLSLGLDLVRQAAQGLAAAHTLGVVHRDIKPDNLLLTHVSGTQQGETRNILKICDFGLARLTEDGGVSTTGAPMGTLAYMSPEQCQGIKLDGRSDLYSLGIVLYEVVTGYQPFQINNFNDALYKHMNVAPPSPRKERPDLPPIIEEIILRCLAKKPEDRFATTTELAAALQKAMGNVGSMPLTMPYPSPEQLTPAGGTVLQPPGSGGTLPPVVSTLVTSSTIPRIRVLDKSGQTLQVVEIKSQGLVVGRQSGNDIVLSADGISRQHVQVLWNGTQVTVKDLGSSNGTLLGDIRLLPQVNQIWMERQLLRIGPFWLRLEGASAGTGNTQTVLRPVSPNATNVIQTQSFPSMVSSGRFGIHVVPKALTINPGQSATIQVMLTNLGSTVDWFTPTVEGVPPQWVQGAGQEVQLNPGMQETVELGVNVTRTPNNLAQDYPVTIRVRSREKPDETGAIQVRWTVLPFKEDVLKIEPRRASGRGSASYTVSLNNGGNTPGHYELRGEDDEQKMDYRFSNNLLDLAPGREGRVPLTVKTRRHWIGNEQRRPFQIHALATGGNTPLTTVGEFVNKVLIPTWVFPIALVVVAAGVGLASFLGVLPSPFGQASPTPTPTTVGIVVPTPTIPVIGTPTTAPGVTPTPMPSPTQMPTATPSPTQTPTATPTPDYTVREINNDDPGISYTGSCGYNHGLSSSLYNDDVEICKQQNDAFTYTFTGKSIYLVTVYYENLGGTISCYIDGSLTQSFNLNSSGGVDSSGFKYGVELPIAPTLVYKQHTASCTMTSASGTYFFVDALVINK